MVRKGGTEFDEMTSETQVPHVVLKPFERWLQVQRFNRVMPYLHARSRILDIGCHDGALFKHVAHLVADHAEASVGIDPDIDQPVFQPRYQLLRGSFPDDLPAMGTFDVITMLGVLEHLLPNQLAGVGTRCVQLLRPGGYFLITVPHPFVDVLLHGLRWLRLVDGVHFEQHHGFDASSVPQLISCHGLSLDRMRRFELGLNYLYVFRKGTAARDDRV